MDSLIAKIPTTSISWQSLHFICRAWWLTGRFLTYLKINDMKRTMLSHLTSQAHPVRLFLGFNSIKPPRVLFPLSLQDASPSPSYHHSSPPPPAPRSSTLITRPPCLLHVEVLEDPEGGSHGLPPPHQTSEIFYCWSDNILATTRSHITPQMADLAEGSGE